MIARDVLPLLPVFQTVAARGGFTAASGPLGISPAAVSQAIQGLESRLGVRLFDRTSRSVRLTDEGDRLLKRLTDPMGEIADALDGARDTAGPPSGTLRISLSRLAAEVCILARLSGFVRKYPAITLELGTDDRLTDIVLGGYDAGIRFEAALERDMVARRIGPPLRRSILGSPAYFARMGRPARPGDLLSHDVVRYRFPGSQRLEPLTFVEDGAPIALDPRPRMVLDDNGHIAQAVRDGLGVAQRFRLTEERGIANGTLEEVLVAFEPPPVSLHVYYPSRRKTARLQAFVDWFA